MKSRVQARIQAFFISFSSFGIACSSLKVLLGAQGEPALLFEPALPIPNRSFEMNFTPEESTT
jgi:hypothetical protein